ncbi:MAG: hypothetical protein QW680_12430, partial [Pyrobaculum sp.]
MRLFLLLATLLVVTTAAASTADIDIFAYEIVKARHSDTTMYLFIPRLGYVNTGKMRILVIALPYIPEDNRHSSIAEIGGAVLTSISKGNFQPLIDVLSRYRNLLLPYETFKIKLVFIIFVDTQSLISMGLDTVKELISSPTKDIVRYGLLYFTSPVLNYMSYNIVQNSTKINNILENLQIYLNDISKVQNSYQVCEADVQYDSSQRFERGGCERNISCKTECINNCTKTIVRCTDTCRCRFNIQVDYRIPHASGKAGDLIYSIDITRSVENGTIKSVDRQCNYTFTPDDNGRNYFIDLFLNYYTPTPIQLKAIFTGYNNTKILNIKNNIYNNVSDYFKNFIKFSQVSGKSCNLKDIERNIYLQYKLNVLMTRKFIEEKINITNNIITNFFKMYLPALGVVDRAISGLSDSVVSCVEDITKSVGGKIVSSVPVAGQIYALLNGVVGALQKQISIQGSVELSGNIYKVDDHICRGGKIVDGNDVFISKPSTVEAIVAGVLGFVSGLAKSFAGETANIIDMIPIIREVDLPTVEGNPPVEYYYMITSRPGFYNIKITVNVNNLIENVVNNIKTSIKESLENVSKKLQRQDHSFVAVLNNAIENHIIIDNPDEIIENQIIRDLLFGVDKELTIEATILSVPAYIYGGVQERAVKYRYSYDFANFVSVTNVSKFIEDATGKPFADACKIIFKIILEWKVDPKIKEAIDKSTDEIFRSQHPVCSPKGIFLRSVKAVVSDFMKSFVDVAMEFIHNTAITWTCNIIGNAITSLLWGDAGFDILQRSLSSCGGLDECLYLYSYSFASFPIRPPESPAVARCYGAVVTPYFRYKTPELTESNFIKIILDNIDFISSSRCKGCGNILLSKLKDIEVKQIIKSNIFNAVFSYKIQREQNENKWVLLLSLSDVEVGLFGLQFPLPFFQNLVSLKIEGDNRTVLKSDLFRIYLMELNKSDIRKKVFESISKANEFVSYLRSLAWDYKMVELPVVAGGFGVNLFFSAFRVYPAVVLREDLSNVYDNPYYFVLPYSVPSRELFVLGALDGRVLYDRSEVWKLGGVLYGMGQVGWSNTR